MEDETRSTNLWCVLYPSNRVSELPFMTPADILRNDGEFAQKQQEI